MPMSQLALQVELAALWRRAMPVERRTRVAFEAFMEAELLKAGKRIFAAEYDAGGNCRFCGECGRCPGWHYVGEPNITQ